ncbi:type I polyketide synthase, partial [Streptomyces sp. NRAIS4]
TFDTSGADTDAVVTGSLRREEGGLRRLLASMAEVFVRGVNVDWTGVLPAAGTRQLAHIDLPTYAFDHKHYWLRETGSATDAASLGQAAADHPLLGAVVRLPQSDGLVFTSRLSLKSHAWLADHAVGGVVILPGSGLVELAVRAGDEAGCGVLDELVIEVPLVVPQQGGVRVQVAVGAPGENGSRTVEIYSQREEAAEDGEAWTRHAAGTVSAASAAQENDVDFAAWPPVGAESVEVGDFYGDLEERGYGYGPAFQGVRAVWRRGEEVFAEVALPEEQRKDAGRFGVHPALLDAALQAATIGNAAGAEADDSAAPVLAFAWNGLVLHASGASALRVRIAPNGADTLRVQAADEAGGLVVTLDSLVSRAVSAEQLETPVDTAVANALFRLEWSELPAVPGSELPPSWVPVTTADDVAAVAASGAAPAVVVLEAVGDDGEDAVLALTSRVLEVVQTWLTSDGLEESQLVVATRGAVPAGADGAVTDPAGAAVWGLVRAAQSENPDRFVLLDTDPADEGAVDSVLDSVLGPVVAAQEPQVAVRAAGMSIPRLARFTGHVADTAATFGPEGTVLISGGGSLGALAARHLVVRHGVRHLVLASRRGPDADGVQELRAELAEQGAELAVVACDVSDREQIEALLAALPQAQPLRGVVHTAGVFDDGLIGALTPERLAKVFAPKVNAVRHLDELTRGLDLDAFVVYSSVAGLSGGAGQGNYSAANAFLDGLMSSRRAAGLPGLSLAWGLWEQSLGMAGHLSAVDQARASRSGVLEISAAEGMELFDAALGAGQALLVPVKLDLRGVRADATAGAAVPHLLRGLVRTGRQQARAASTADENKQLSDRLAGLTAAEQEALLLDLVRTQSAVVLGHSEAEGVRSDTAFKELGFDSLTSVELRNRLREATGLKLPPTLVFDYPNPLALARHLLEEFGDIAAPRSA